MTREEKINTLKALVQECEEYQWQRKEILFEIIKDLQKEPSRDIEEIKEVINCDADAEAKCRMISDILTAKPHYFEES